MTPHKVVARRVKEGKKAPGVTEDSQPRFSWEEVDVHYMHIGNELPCSAESVDSAPHCRLKI